MPRGRGRRVQPQGRGRELYGLRNRAMPMNRQQPVPNRREGQIERQEPVQHSQQHAVLNRRHVPVQHMQHNVPDVNPEQVEAPTMTSNRLVYSPLYLLQLQHRL